METGEGQNQSPLTMDLAGLVETVQGSAREQVAYLVDMAKADASRLNFRHYARIVCVAPGFLPAGKWRPSFSWDKIVTTRLYVVIESAWTMTSANVNSMLRLCCDVEEPGNCRFS